VVDLLVFTIIIYMLNKNLQPKRIKVFRIISQKKRHFSRGCIMGGVKNLIFEKWDKESFKKEN